MSSLGRAALLVSAGILLSRILGFAREIVLAGILGDTNAGDAYDAAFLIPDYLNYLLAGGYLAITFIPIISRYMSEGDQEGGWAAFTAVFRPVAFLIVALAAATFALAGPLVELLFRVLGGFEFDQIGEVTHLTRIVLPAQIFFVLGSLFAAVQYAHRRFLIPTLAPLIYNLGIITGGLVAAALGSPSPDGFAWGALTGAFVGNFLIQWYGARKVGLRWIKSVPILHPALREYLLMALPLMLGQSIVFLDESVTKVFASMADEGSIFLLGRARRLNMLPVGVIAQAAGVAAYPFLARLAAEGRMDELKRTMTTALRHVVFAGLAATALLAALSEPVVRVAYQRGNWSSDATVLAASSLVLFSLSIPAWGAQQVYARGFYARRQMWVPVLVGTAGTLVAIPVFFWFFELMGVPGLALASTVALTGYTAAMGLIWYARTGREQLRPLLDTLWRSLVAAGAAAAAAWGVSRAVTGGVIPDFAEGLAAVLVGGLTAALVYLAAAAVLRSSELAQLAGRLRSR